MSSVKIAASLFASTVMLLGVATTSAQAATVSPRICDVPPASTPNTSSRVYTVDAGGAPLRTADSTACGAEVKTLAAGHFFYEWCSRYSVNSTTWIYGRYEGDTNDQADWVYVGDLSYSSGGEDTPCP